MISPDAALRVLRNTKLFLTVTPGRSGTKLLARIMTDLLGVQAEHEAAPRLNYVLRAVQAAPECAAWWLSSEKMPAIASRLDGRPYADISHLYCKGFIEPLLKMRLKPHFIILTRPAREVALSMLAVGSIPERSAKGQLVLVGPRDPGVLVPEGWEAWNDYQLCYWYAREIERRQDHYEKLLAEAGCPTLRCAMNDLTNVHRIRPLVSFVTGNPEFELDLNAYREIVSVNQNPSEGLRKPVEAAKEPPDTRRLAHEEAEVNRMLTELKKRISSKTQD